MTKKIIYLFSLIILSLFDYYILSYTDFRFDLILRILAMLIGWVYFYFLCEFLLKKRFLSVMSIFIMLFHFVIIMEASEKINYLLLDENYKEINATIKDCTRVGGSEYCVYCYFVNGKYFEKKFLNKAPKYIYMKGDKVEIQYYTNNPAISRLK